MTARARYRTWTWHAARKVPWAWTWLRMGSWSQWDVEGIPGAVCKSWLWQHMHLLGVMMIVSQKWLSLLVHKDRYARLSISYCDFVLVLTNKVWVVRFLFIVHDHRLNIREHVLALAETALLHLTFLYDLHSVATFDHSIAITVVFFLVVYRLLSKYLLLKWMLLLL